MRKFIASISLISTAAFTLAIILQIVLNDSKVGQSTEARTAIHFNELASVPVTDILLPKPTSSRVVVASWYGEAFQGKPMANGEPFDMDELTIAHKTLPLGTRVRIENPENGREVIAIVTDRGPYIDGREIDLSRRCAKMLGLLRRGTGLVEFEVLA